MVTVNLPVLTCSITIKWSQSVSWPSATASWRSSMTWSSRSHTCRHISHQLHLSGKRTKFVTDHKIYDISSSRQFILAVIQYTWGGGTGVGGGEGRQVILFSWMLCCLICTIMPVIFASYLFMPVHGVLLDTVGLKWAVSVLEWLSECLLGAISGTFLNLGMNDFSHACVCHFCVLSGRVD